MTFNPDCFVAALLAMTFNLDCFVAALLAMTFNLDCFVAALLAMTSLRAKRSNPESHDYKKTSVCINHASKTLFPALFANDGPSEA